MNLVITKWIVILLTLNLVTVSNSYAEWIHINTSDSGSSAYVDFDSKRKTLSKVKMWSLDDYNSTKQLDEMSNKKNKKIKNKYKSTKYLYEYDCEKYESKLLYQVYYSRNLGEGEPIDSLNYSFNQYTPVIPDTLGEYKLKIACDLNLEFTDWVLVSSLETHDLYYSPKSLNRKADIVKVSQLVDIKNHYENKELNFKSIYTVFDYDCIGNSNKQNYIKSLSGNMGKGAVINEETTPEKPWRVIPPDTQFDKMLKAVCSQ